MNDHIVFTGCLLASVSALLSASPDPVAHGYALILAGAVGVAAIVGCVWMALQTRWD